MKRKSKSGIQIANDTVRRKVRLDVDAVNAGDEGLAALVKQCYIQERGWWESQKDGRPVQYIAPNKYDGTDGLFIEEVQIEDGDKNQWMELTLWCEARGVDPVAYIRLQFEILPITKERAPEPKQLKNDKYLSLWENYSPRIFDRIKASLYIEKEIAETMFWYIRCDMPNGKITWRHVIVNTSLELSPLFRYCLASRIRGKSFTLIAARYEPAAVLQFERHRAAYLQSWNGLLPQDFADRAKYMYPYLLSR